MENKLKEIFNVILEEIKVNKEFEAKINIILTGEKPKKKVATKKEIIKPSINPIVAIDEGQAILEKKLAELSIDELKSVIKYYDMDSSNSYSRWRKKDRFISYIVEVALVRANKGHAFRKVEM